MVELTSLTEIPVGALKSDWAIIVSIFILAILQGYKIYADTRANRNKLKFDSRLESTMNNIELYLKILSDKYTEEVTDIQMPIVIDEFVGHMKECIFVEASTSITRNDIKNNKKEIETKLETFINNRYKSLYTNLGRFKWKGRYMNEFVNLNRKEKLISNVNEIVLKERDTKEQLLQAYRNLRSSCDQRFDELKNEILNNAYSR